MNDEAYDENLESFQDHEEEKEKNQATKKKKISANSQDKLGPIKSTSKIQTNLNAKILTKFSSKLVQYK